MAGLGLGLVAAAARAGGIAAGGLAPPLRGWDPVFDAGTQADTVLAPGDDIQAAVDAAHAGGQPATIALRGGTYRQSVLLPDGASGLTLKRYGAERPVLTGAEPLTGWTRATVADEPVLGAGYGAVYRTSVPTASAAHDTAHLLNLHHDGAARYIAQDVAAHTDPVSGRVEPGDRAYIEFDSQFHETGVSYAYDGSDVITAITAPAVFGAYTRAQLEAEGVVLAVYCSSNRTALATVTSYDPASFTAQVTSASGGFVRAVNGREAFGIVNLPAALREGEWAALRNGAAFDVYYRPRPGEAAGLDAAMEYSARRLGIDIGGATDLTLRGLEVVQYANGAPQGSAGIGSGTSGRRLAAKSGLRLEHCRLASMQGADYGALNLENSAGTRVSRVTIESMSGIGSYFADSSDLVVSGLHARRCGQTGLRAFGIVGGLFHDILFEDNGRGGHSNQLVFYEGCDEIAVAFLETRDCYGYVTHQEASNVTYYMSSIGVDRRGNGNGRGITDQNRGAGAGQGGADGSGAPVADSDIRYICLDLAPYDFSEPNALSAGGGNPATGERAVILNNVLHGGGLTKVYTEGRSPALEVRDGNIYTGLAYWQDGAYGWAPAAGEILSSADAVYADLAAGDLSHRGDSPVRGATGVDITAHVAALEAAWPGVAFRRDLRGRPVDPAAPPVGALAERGPVPVTAPGRMAAPTLGGLTTDGLTVTLAADPHDGASLILSRDLRHAVSGGAWVEVQGVGATTELTGLASNATIAVQTRAVNAVGAGAWSASAEATTLSGGLPDGIVSDPRFLDAGNWSATPSTGIGIGSGLDMDGTNGANAVIRTITNALFPIQGGADHQFAFDISRLAATGKRLRFQIYYYTGSTTASGAASVANSGRIGGSTIMIGATGDYGPYALPNQPPADATHAQMSIQLIDAAMDMTLSKVSLAAV